VHYFRQPSTIVFGFVEMVCHFRQKNGISSHFSTKKLRRNSVSLVRNMYIQTAT